MNQPELVIALCGAIGTDLDFASQEVVSLLKSVDYKSEVIRLSDLIHQAGKLPEKFDNHFVRSWALMEAGNRLRRDVEHGAAVAWLGIAEIRSRRKSLTGKSEEAKSNQAYILRGLKNPSETAALRKVYGSSFIQLGIYSSVSCRKDSLTLRMLRENPNINNQELSENVSRLMKRDQKESDKYGQNLSDTYHLSDVFLDISNKDTFGDSLWRYIRLLFGDYSITPTKSENAMFIASSSALRSASLSRQVGAAIVDRTGSLISVGCNDVPSPSGGLYWSEDQNRQRDVELGHEPNDIYKQRLLLALHEELSRSNALREGLSIDEFKSLVAKTPLTSIIEYSRCVHAEVTALLDAARRGVGTGGAILYTTTFPCHDCTKHIIAAGISEVQYIEPYPKSLALELHTDAISVDEPHEKCAGRIPFRSFLGISPTRYQEWFTPGTRKDPSGFAITWDSGKAKYRFGRQPESYLSAEVLALATLEEKVRLSEEKTDVA